MTSPSVLLIVCRTLTILQIISPFLTILTLFMFMIIGPIIDLIRDLFRRSIFMCFDRSFQSKNEELYEEALEAECKRGRIALRKFDIIHGLTVHDTADNLCNILFDTQRTHSIANAFTIYKAESLSRFRTYYDSWSACLFPFQLVSIDKEVMNIYSYVCHYLNGRTDFGGKGYRIIYNGDAEDGKFRLFKITEVSGLVDECAFYKVEELGKHNDPIDSFYLMGQFMASNSIYELRCQIHESARAKHLKISPLDLGYAFGYSVDIHDLDLEIDMPFDDGVRVDIDPVVPIDDDDSDSDSDDFDPDLDTEFEQEFQNRGMWAGIIESFKEYMQHDIDEIIRQ